MKTIQRSLILLKPDGAFSGSGHQAALKLQTSPNGLTAQLGTLPLPTGNYALYLFDAGGQAHLAGRLTDGGLNVTIPSLSLRRVAGAAVADLDNLKFIYKSSGLNWTKIAAQFKFAHAEKKTAPKPPPASEEPPAPPRSETAPATEEPTPPRSETAPVTEEPAPPRSETAPVTEEPAPPRSDNAPEDKDDAPELCDSCPHAIRQDKINPFPDVFPDSEWVKISYPGPTGWWHYISGTIRNGDTVVARALGVPGEYGMAPPIWLEGFGTYMRCVTPDARGYWLMFQDAETGEVLDMGLSPHGE